MMQDVQNIPPPNVNPTEREDDFGSHLDIDQDLDNDEAIPVPSDQQPVVPIKDPPDVNKSPIDENEDEPKRIA